MKCSLFFLSALLSLSAVNIQAEEVIFENDLSLHQSSSSHPHHHRRRSCPPGSTGPAGPTGSTGAEGDQGPDGTGPTFVYGNFINNGPVAIPSGFDIFIPLTQDVFSDGISLDENDNTMVIIDAPGLYLVGFSLTIDGTESPSGIFNFSILKSSLATVSVQNTVAQNLNSASAQTIVGLPEGATLQLDALFNADDPGNVVLTNIRFFATRVGPLLE